MVITVQVAIFDFDGTLYKKETFKLLMDHLKHHPIYHTNFKQFYRAILPIYIGYKLKLYPESKMKERSMQLYLEALQHLSKEELHTYFTELAHKMGDDFNTDVIERLHVHQQNKVHVMLVSGAYKPLLTAVVAKMDLHFDTIIGTEVLLKNNHLDKNASIYHIQGERKVQKVQEALRTNDINWKQSFAYGDSFSDLSILQLVGHPVAVQPDAKLRSTAENKGWEII